MGIDIKLVIFSVTGGKLRVFLNANKLPEGVSRADQILDREAARIFGENINISLADLYFEQLYTISNPGEIAVVYYFLVPEHKIYSKIGRWASVSDIKNSKNDNEIINYAVQRLRWKIEYTNAVYSLLPAEFTFSQLQSVYEAILGKTLDKRNFHKKILALNILKSTGRKKREGRARPALPAGRPAQLYTFRTKRLSYVTILR